MSPSKAAGLIVLVFIVLAGSAMVRTSVTFDEPVFFAVGARGFHTGDFTLVNDHPRVPQYVYGAAALAATDHWPEEAGRNWSWYSRYHYARALLWGSGNAPEKIIVAARLVALLFGTLTVAATWLLTRRRLGAGAVLAALLVAFLPDMLAHSGVAYNDIPLAFGVLVSAFALDRAVREPSTRNVVVSALATALTLCVKYSAMVLFPVLLAMLALEALSGRWKEPAWRRAALRAIPVFTIVVYLVIALLYLGDWTLCDFRSGLAEITRSSLAGRTAFLLGERNSGGWWYFFPVVFLLKTPVALHVMLLVALASLWAAIRPREWRALAGHWLRPAFVTAGFFAAALLASRVNIGMRHALPMMPPLLILVAAGVWRIWEREGRTLRFALGTVAAAYVLSTASHYPYFLSYLSDYARGRPLHRTLVDSSTDWGQGLVALRAFMRERGIDQVALAYFGSALPEGYGIRYTALPSYLELPDQPPADPRYLVVSATLLTGQYARGDPYAPLRDREPVAIVADVLYVFDRARPGGGR